MSNEVNQAFLRAYVKNRAEVALQTGSRNAHPSQRPDRSDNSAQPLPESPSLRVDQGISNTQPQRTTRTGQPIPAPHLVRPAASPSQVPSSPGTNPTAVRGVWSPTGVERGVKGINIGANGPAMVSNPSPPLSPLNTTRLNSTTILPASQPAVLPPATYSSEHALPNDGPYRRVDAAHTNAKQSHLNPPSAAPQTQEHTAAKETRPLPVPKASPNFEIKTSRHAVHGSHAVAKQPAAATIPIANQVLQETPLSAPQLSRASSTRREDVSLGSKKPAIPLPVSFAPSWEVDQFYWPEVLVQMQKSDLDAFELVAKHLRMANQDGLKVMAVTSGERGVGRSTVTMHMARCAASAGLSVALIDADGFYPSLVDQLRIDANHGWQDCLFENTPLEEVAVKSLADNITFFPLTSIIPTQQLHANLHRMTKVIKRISTAFDMVFLDSNRLNLEQRDLIGVSQESIIDAAIVVTDSELSIKEKVDTAISILQGMGIASIGVVQNFHG